MKTSRSEITRSVNADVNCEIEKQSQSGLKSRVKSPSPKRNIAHLNYAGSMFDRNKMMTKYPKTPPPVVQTKNNRFVFKRSIKTGSSKGNLYMLKFPKWNKTSPKKRRCRRCEIIRGPGAICNCPSKKMTMFIEGCQVVKNVGLKNEIGINTSNSLGFFNSHSKSFGSKIYIRNAYDLEHTTEESQKITG